MSALYFWPKLHVTGRMTSLDLSIIKLLHDQYLIDD